MIIGHTVMFRDGMEGKLVAVELGEYEYEVGAPVTVKVTGFIGLIMLSDRTLTSRPLEGAMIAKNPIPDRPPPTSLPGRGEPR